MIRTMPTMEFIGVDAFDLDTKQRQWLHREPTVDVLAICPDEQLKHIDVSIEKPSQPCLVRRRIEYKHS